MNLIKWRDAPDGADLERRPFWFRKFKPAIDMSSGDF
jgi:hypothetical protein